MRGKRIGVVLGALVFLAGLGVGIWWALLPHSAADILALARDLEQELQEKMAEATPEERAALQEEILRTYARVPREYPEALEEQDQAEKRVAELLEEWERFADAAKAWRRRSERLAKGTEAEEALLRVARIQEENLEDPTAAAETYTEFCEKFSESERAPEAFWQRIRLARARPDDVPLEEVRRLCEELRDKYPDSDYADDAAFEIARIYEEVEEVQAALDAYRQFVEDHPDSDLADDAQKAIGDIFAEKMEDYAQAREAYERLEREHPDSPYAGAAGGLGRAAAESETEGKEQEAASKEEDYLKERYGKKGGDVSRAILTQMGQTPREILRDLLDQKLDAEKYELEVVIEPEDEVLRVAGSMTFRSLGDAPRAEYVLQFHPSMEMTSLACEGQDVSFTEGEGRLRFHLPKALGPGEAVTIQFASVGEMGLDPMIRIGEYGFVLSSAIWFPFTLWGDLFTVRASFRVPEGSRVVAGGSPADEAETVWETDREVFLFCFAYGPYERHDAAGGSPPITFYAPKGSTTDPQAVLEEAGRVVEFYSGRFSPYPYRRLSLVEAELDVVGGVGTPALVFLDGELLSTRSHEMPANLIAHEIAHQWWGDLVPVSVIREGYCPWLSEGFACYADALYTEHRFGSQRMVQHLTKYSYLYFERMMQLSDRPIHDCWSTHPNYFAVVYMKGAVVLHSLRRVMGDDAFFASMRRYAEEYAGLSSTVEDFRKICEEDADTDLFWFFNEWIHLDGFPHFRLVEVRSRPEGDGFAVEVDVEQVGRVFRAPVEILFRAGDREERRVITLSRERQVLEVTLPFAPETAEIDPDGGVLKHPGPDNLWPPRAPDSSEEEGDLTDE